MKLAKFSHFTREISFLKTFWVRVSNYLESSTLYCITLASIMLKPPCHYLCISVNLASIRLPLSCHYHWISVALTSIQLKPPRHYHCLTLKTIRYNDRCDVTSTGQTRTIFMKDFERSSCHRSQNNFSKPAVSVSNISISILIAAATSRAMNESGIESKRKCHPSFLLCFPFIFR